jgi:hypothetical protein
MGKRQRTRDRHALELLEKHIDNVDSLFRSSTLDLFEALRPDGTVPIKIISPGWGTRGYYSAEVLKRDGPKAWPAGTHMYLDHPSLTEAADRPERSLRDLAGVLETGAIWRDDHPQGPGLYADSNVFPQFREAIAAMAPHIGISIRASGTGKHGEAEGRTGSIVESITHGHSVDFVTKAGRGGEVLALAEAAGLELTPPADLEEAGTVGVWFESRIHQSFTCLADDMYGDGRLTRAERIALSSAIGDALDAFTAAVTAKAPALFDRNRWDDPTEDDPNTDPLEESAMPITKEEKAELIKELRESVLEEARGEITKELDEAKSETAAEKARADKAEQALLIREAQSHTEAEVSKIDGLPKLTAMRISEAIAGGDIPTVTVDGAVKLDKTKLDESIKTLVDSEVKYLEEAGVKVGGGNVFGLGGNTDTTKSLDEAAKVDEEALAKSFQELGMSESAAKAAAAG